MRKFRVLDVFEDCDSGALIITVWNASAGERSTIVMEEKLDIQVGYELEYNNTGGTSVELRVLQPPSKSEKVNFGSRKIGNPGVDQPTRDSARSLINKNGVWELGSYLAGSRVHS